jgi:predicted porin
MKKVVLAAISTCYGVNAAYAQSSVTLYGIADMGIIHVSNAQTSRTFHKARGYRPRLRRWSVIRTSVRADL